LQEKREIRDNNGENMIKLIKPADIVTLLCALLVQFNNHDWKRQHDAALVLILAAVIADAADGAWRGTQVAVLGANLDSLADVISFGVAPLLQLNIS